MPKEGVLSSSGCWAEPPEKHASSCMACIVSWSKNGLTLINGFVLRVARPGQAINNQSLTGSRAGRAPQTQTELDYGSARNRANDVRFPVSQTFLDDRFQDGGGYDERCVWLSLRA